MAHMMRLQSKFLVLSFEISVSHWIMWWVTMYFILQSTYMENFFYNTQK